MSTKWVAIAVTVALLGTAQQESVSATQTVEYLATTYGIQHNQNANTDAGCQLELDEGVICWGGVAGFAGRKDGTQGAIQIAGSNTSSCVLLSTAEVACWGSNTGGQLGQGTTDTTHRRIPILVPGLTGVDSIFAGIAGGATRFCAHKVSNEMICWGSYPYTPTPSPRIYSRRNAATILMEGLSSDSPTICFISTDRQLACGREPTFRAPIQGEILKASMSGYRVCGVTTEGNVVCGDTRNEDSGTTTYANGDAVDVAITTNKTCLLKNDTSVVCWGIDLAQAPESTEISAFAESQARVVELDSNGQQIYAFLSDGQQLRLTQSTEEVGLKFTPYLPANLSKGIQVHSTENEIALSWKGKLSGQAVVDYRIEVKDKNTNTWREVQDGISTQKSAVVSNLQNATNYVIRITPVLENNSPEDDVAQYELGASTAGMAANTFVLKDEYGFPVIDATLSWETLDGNIRSSKQVRTNSNGVASFSRIPSRYIRLNISEGKMLGMESISGRILTLASRGSQNISLPNPPPRQQVKARVTLPDGHPVPDASVLFQGLDDTVEVSSEQFNGYVYSELQLQSKTDEQGIAEVVGWRSSESLEAQASLDDGVIYQQTDWKTLHSDITDLQFEYFPIVETEKLTIETIRNKFVPIDFQIVDPLTDAPVSNARISIVPPKNANQSRCKGKPKLSAVSSPSGIAGLKVCASAAGDYKVNSVGSVTVGSLQIRLKNAAPSRPRNVEVIYLNNESQIAWGDAPASADAPVTAFKITARAFGTSDIFRRTVALGSEEFSNRVLSLSGLEGKRISAIEILAVSRKGESEKQKKFVVVRSFE